MIPENDAPTGGSLRDIDLAAAEMAAAVGNEQAAAAMHNFAAALRNESMTTVIPTLQTVLQGVMKQGFDSLKAQIDRSDRASLDHRTDLRLHLDARFDNYGSELDRLIKQTGDLQGGQAVLRDEFLKIGESLTQIQIDFGALSAEVAQVSAELTRSREHRARLQAAVDKIEAQMLAPGERERLLAQHDALVQQVASLERRIGMIEARLTHGAAL